MDDKKKDRLIKICDNINKSLGSKSSDKIITYIGDSEREPLKRILSGCDSLDDALGGGWPLGRIVEIYGSEGSGKTTLCYHAIKSFQESDVDGEVAWVDSEFSFDPDYAEQIGVDVNSILFHQPEYGEQALEVVRKLMSQKVGLIVVDSVAALTPRSEIEGDVGSHQMGAQARLMSQAMRMLTGDAGRNDVLLMFTNQERDKIGQIYGSKHTTPGGRALRFYSSIRLELRAIGQEKDGELPVAVRVKAITKKNKVAPPLRTTNYIITFGKGIDRIAGLFDDAVENKIIEKSGAWYSFNSERLGQGKQNALEILRSTPKYVDEISKRLKNEDENEEDNSDDKLKGKSKRGRKKKDEEKNVEENISEEQENEEENEEENDIGIEDV